MALPLKGESLHIVDQRHRGRLAAAFFLFVHPLYTLLQVTALLADVLPAQVEADVFVQSIVVNAILDITALIYFLALGRARGSASRRFEVGTVVVAVILILGWVAQLHFGGSQSSHILPLLLGTLVVFSYFLRAGLVIGLGLFITAALVLLVGLEVSGALPYSPLLAGDRGMEALFFDWRIVGMNAVIYGCTFTLTLAVLLRTQSQLSRSQDTLRNVVKELSEANDRMRAMLHATAHDLRSPLTAIGGFTELLQMSLDEHDDTQREVAHARRISEGVAHMSRLVDDLNMLLLDSKDPLKLQTVDLAEVVHGLAALLEPTLKRRGVRLDIGALYPIVGDRSLLTRVMQNLVENALKFSPDKPELHIHALRRDDEVVCFVDDRGLGIPDDMREAVFQPFRRVAGRAVPGSGIGLAVCRKAVADMAGRIWLEPRTGGGTRACVALRAPEND